MNSSWDNLSQTCLSSLAIWRAIAEVEKGTGNIARHVVVFTRRVIYW